MLSAFCVSFAGLQRLPKRYHRCPAVLPVAPANQAPPRGQGAWPCNGQKGSVPAVLPLGTLRYYRRPGKAQSLQDSAVVPLSLRRYYRWVCLDSNGREGEGDIFSPSPPLHSLLLPHHSSPPKEDLSSNPQDLHHQPTRGAALWRIEGGGLDLHLHRPESRISISSLFSLC